ncbi:MAG: peptidase C1 [Acidobacteria bacterium]|nr:peptidase C1 [Acidobacteriota bacterium]MBS1865760.1 peptidase C1 [Acidobacteriota bacterium]
MAQDKIDLGQLAQLIQNANAGWQAGYTTLSDLPPEEQKKRLGYSPGPGEQSLTDRETVSLANLASIGIGAVGAPASFDWRNVGGKNFITPVKDQGGCGSCVAFGSTATVEGTFRVQRNDPNLAVDLSEAHLFYCYAKSQGRNCGNGWWVPPALDSYKTGVVDEACFPYTAGDQNCNLCSDWQNRLTKITGWHAITAGADMKTWLSTRGPLSTCFTVYNDFFAYKSGVYRHVTGGVAGGHCVSCVGYDDAQGCWICKNSWSTGWGDAGFFRIAYGECGIDATMWAVDGIEETGWLQNQKVLGLWTIDQDRNAWVYLSQVGWRKIANDNDNIFFDLLTMLIAAKAAGRLVGAYQQQGIIRQIYVW